MSRQVFAAAFAWLVAAALGLDAKVDVQMGTLSKALGVSGGYICGSRLLIDYLINRARPFIFSTAPVPAAAAAATAGVRLVQSEAGYRNIAVGAATVPAAGAPSVAPELSTIR